MTTTTYENPLDGKRSPWGTIDASREIAPGLWQVSTPGHGGVKADRARNAKIPQALRVTGGWYEEDCEAHIPFYVFAAEISEHLGQIIDPATEADAIRQWFPDKWTAHTGEIVTAEQSRIVAEREFKQAHAEDWISTAAWGSWYHSVPEGFVGVVASLGGSRLHSAERRYFLVLQEDYEARSYAHGGTGEYVIDPLLAEDWADHPS